MFKGDGAGRDALFKADGILCDADLFNDCTDGRIFRFYILTLIS